MEMEMGRAQAVLGSGTSGNPVADFIVNGVLDIISGMDLRRLAATCSSQLAQAVGMIDTAPLDDADVLPAQADRWLARQGGAAPELLARASAVTGFRYDPLSPPVGQLRYCVDALINDCVVTAVIDGLKSCMEQGRITDGECRSIAGMLATSGNGPAVNKVYFDAIEHSILASGHDQVYLLSIGCGRGNNDVEIYRAMKAKHPEIDVRLVGFDAHQAVDSNPIVTQCGGIVINRELPAGRTYLDLLREHEDTGGRRAVATERYALHHMNRSLETLLSDLEDVPLVSVDHPVTEEINGSLTARAAMIAYDLLSAQIRTAGFGGGWIPAAMRNPKVFSILYRRAEALQEQVDDGLRIAEVAGKTPPTWIISYPSQWRTPMAIAAE